MKAIVANVLFGAVFGCLSWTNPADAKPLKPTVSKSPIVSAELLEQNSVVPSVFISVDRIIAINKLGSLIDSNHDGQITRNNFDAYLVNTRRNLFLNKSFYTHQKEQRDLILGFHNTFWSSANKRKYWGITTVEHWKKNSDRQFDLPKLNYIYSAPILTSGSSALTVSGGGNKNLASKNPLDRVDYAKKFEEFRGGITYHYGVAKDVTMGAGFVYEDLLIGFTQLTYQSDLLPVQTTFSLLAKDSDINLHSHVRFQPTSNFVVNYYQDEQKQKFDFNWGIVSGFTLVAKGNSQKESYSAGFNLAVRNSYLILSASAALDHDRKLQWKLNSKIGSLKLSYSNNKRKSISKLDVNLFNLKSFGFSCSAFVEYQSRKKKHQQEEFVVWGGKLRSAKKVSSGKHHWTLKLGYGSSSKGKGLVVDGSLALKPDLFLKLGYQEISPVSDDTKIKLQLGTK